MRNHVVTTKTSAQIAADFAAVFQDIQPPRAAAKPVTMADRLAPYRMHILKQRRRGLTWDQIATGMAAPRIGEKVSSRTLRDLFGAPAAPAANPFPADCIVLDPATGKTVPPTA